jgi:hypothetical protein
MSKRQERCETCRFGEKVIAKEPDSPIRCRRYPPTLLPDRSEDAREGSLADGWPWVENTDWCGEWKPISLPVVETDTRSLTALSLPVRIQNALERAEIFTIGDLLQCNHRHLSDGEVSGIGPKSVADIRSRLAALGLKLKGD